MKKIQGAKWIVQKPQEIKQNFHWVRRRDLKKEITILRWCFPQKIK
jgi:hypothetical protein